MKTTDAHKEVPLVDLRAQYLTIQPQIDEAIARVLQSCAFAGGPEVEAFEKAFAQFIGTRHCLAVSSGTAALELLLRAHGIGKDDEVITVANTFFATAEAVSLVGARPVFVDADEQTALIDTTQIEKAITAKTKAIIPVHLYGQAVDMDPILEIAKRHNLIVIEDCAQSQGAKDKGRMTGTMGHSAAFSFYPGKNLGAYGEAGGITTNDDAIAAKVRLLREHGSPTKYEHVIVGRNERMDGIQGAVLGVKLRHLPKWNEARRAIAVRYRKALENHPGITLLQERSDGSHVYHLFVIRIPHRGAVRQALNDAGIGAGIHYPKPLHLQEVYRDLGYKKGDFPVSERMAEEILSLPIYPELAEEQQDYVVRVLKEAL